MKIFLTTNHHSFLEISISGHFELGDTNGEMTMETFELNAVTILLPYLRDCITSFTAQAGISAVILPPVNVFQIMEEKNNE
ncbi:protein-export chaperone SecB [Bacillus paranthracis]